MSRQTSVPRQSSTASSRENTLSRVQQPRPGNVAMNHIQSHACSLVRNSSAHLPTPPPPPNYSLADYANWSCRYDDKRGRSREMDDVRSPYDLNSQPCHVAGCSSLLKDVTTSAVTNIDAEKEGRSDDLNGDIGSEKHLTHRVPGDWRRSAIFTLFLFPPTGLLAMAAALLSHSMRRKGNFRSAKRYGRISCIFVFTSLVLSTAFILTMVLLRVYRIIDNPF